MGLLRPRRGCSRLLYGGGRGPTFSHRCIVEGPCGFFSIVSGLLVSTNREPPSKAATRPRGASADAFWNDSIRPSQSQLGVSHALNVLGWDHEDELRTEDGLSLDMAQPSTKTAVEFDGPTHYLQGPDGPSVDGRTAFKRRLLGRLGWTCAAVPYFEWDPLLASGATEPYLRGVLARLRNE